MEKLGEGNELLGFVRANSNFHLPSNAAEPVVFVGAGTGIAPFNGLLRKNI